MTEFSNSSFIHVGPQSDWSASWTSNSANKSSNSSTTFNNTNAWSSSWDVAGATSNKGSWNVNVKSPSKTSQVQQTPSTTVSGNGWSTSWDVPSDKSPQKPALASPTKSNPPTPNKTENLKVEVKAAKAVENAVIPQQPQEQEGQHHDLTKSSLYKTELCRSWMDKGSCKYGHKCQFAHGHEELRVVVRHPKYKTEFCKTFSATGACPYGNRCRFIHPVDESLSAKTPESNKKMDKQQQFNQDSSNASQLFQSVFSPTGSITPPEMSSSPLKSSPFDVNDLLLMLPTALEDAPKEATTDAEHRLSFFKHLTEL